MPGLSKKCFGFSLPLPKAENCLAEHHRKSSILTMLHPSQLGQNGGAKIFGHRYIIYIWLRSGMWKPFKWLSLKIQNSEKIGGEQMIFAEKAWNLLRSCQNIIGRKKNRHLLYKSILYCQLIPQNSQIVTLILWIWQRSQQNDQFWWFLRNQLTIENTFVKQM